MGSAWSWRCSSPSWRGPGRVGGATLGSVSTRTKGIVGEGSTGGVDAARKVGAAVAELAKNKKIEEVVFNRNGFLYHGRVKALAEAAREAGLKF